MTTTAIQHSLAELDAFRDAVRGLLQHTDFKSAARELFEACRSVLHAEAGYVALLGSEGENKELVHLHPESVHAIDPTLSTRGPGVGAEAYRQDRTVSFNNFIEYEWAGLLPPGHTQIANVLSVPVSVGDETDALFLFANKPGGFTEQDAWLASAFGDIAALALSNSRMVGALESSEERYRAIAQSAADAIIIIDTGGRVVSWNGTAERLFGYSVAEISGREVTELMPDRFRESHRVAFERACATPSYDGRIIEMAGIRKSGAEFPLELSLARWKTREGMFFTGIIRDISARRRAEFERSFLIDASRSLTSSLDSEATLQRLVSVAVPALADCCIVEMLGDEAHATRMACAHPDPAMKSRIAEYACRKPFRLDGDGVFARVVRTGEPMIVPRATENDIASLFSDPGYCAMLCAIGLSSFVVVPLSAGDRPLGVLAWFRSATAPSYDERDLVLAQEIGRRAATAFENARLHEATEHERARLLASIQERRRLRRHIVELRSQIRGALASEEIVGESRAFRAALEQARMVAQCDTTVLLLGETGVGKELLARLIHQWSRRSRAVLIPVNCASIPEALVESELFGYEKGAFTGATERRAGKFEAANRGTLLLDEVGDLPLNAQAKLLRVLQDGQVQRVGSNTLTKVDTRVITATNHDLDQAVREKRFRVDLYFRLGVFPIRLPPLRERLEDIGPLFEYFVAHFARRLHHSVAGIDRGVFERLTAYSWPGNVRELQNVAERAVILTLGNVIELESIVLPMQSRASRGIAGTLADTERHAILEALMQCDGRVSGRRGAAQRLGLKPTTLHAKMRKLGINRPSRHTSI